MSDLFRLLERELGVDTFDYTNRETSQVQLAATRIMRNDPNRVAIILINLSTGTIHFGPFTDPSSSKGIRLDASGGSVVMIWNEDFHLVGREFYAVSTVANADVLVLEVVTKPGVFKPVVEG